LKKPLKILAFVATISVTNVLFAATPSTGYKIFIDAGSNSSRIHLFHYALSGNATPVITELFTEKAKPALASYASDPDNAGDSLKKILDATLSQLRGLGVTTPVPVNVYATAGMGLLPVNQQNAIYREVTAFIKDNYTQLTPGDIQTIPGTMEGLYAWLEANYLAENFQNHQPTIGTIDMGGASTQLAFEATGTKPRNKTLPVTINGQPYRVFSVSFLGLGINQARASMGHSALNTRCYPANYPMNSSDVGDFSFSACQSSYSKIISGFHVHAQVPPLRGQKFLAFSGVYYAYHFFMPAATGASKQLALEAQIKHVCAKPWSQLQSAYPSESKTNLATYCANGTYIDQLLYQSYHLTDAQLTINNKMNGKSMDWTLGAALYSLIT